MKLLKTVVLTATLSIIFNGFAGAGQTDAPALKPAGPVTITSDRMEADNGRGVVVFKGNVAAVEDFTLCADELTVNYGVGSEVTDIVATGNVRIFQDGRTQWMAVSRG